MIFEFTTDLTLTYADKVGVMLYNLKMEEPFIISEKVKPANREKFISAVKNYADNSLGLGEGWRIEFNSDYSKVRKIYYYEKTK